MYAYLKRLYVDERRLDEAGLDKAVAYKWIDAKQAATLKGLRTKAENAETEEPETPPVIEPETPTED